MKYMFQTLKHLTILPAVMQYGGILFLNVLAGGLVVYQEFVELIPENNSCPDHSHYAR